ncbi:hypothetical protein ACFX2B_012024 [Malus domestica]
MQAPGLETEVPNLKASVPPSKRQPGQVFPSSRSAGPPPTRSPTPAPGPNSLPKPSFTASTSITPCWQFNFSIFLLILSSPFFCQPARKPLCAAFCSQHGLIINPS